MNINMNYRTISIGINIIKIKSNLGQFVPAFVYFPGSKIAMQNTLKSLSYTFWKHLQTYNEDYGMYNLFQINNFETIQKD